MSSAASFDESSGMKRDAKENEVDDDGDEERWRLKVEVWKLGSDNGATRLRLRWRLH